MEKKTDSKSIAGLILKVGSPKQYCSIWGEMLFRGREVIVGVGDSFKKQKIPMYIRDDSDVGILNLASCTLEGKIWNLGIHGEKNTPMHGCIFIDRINLLAEVPKFVTIDDLF